ncbi:potassium-transporting ATPase subunit KdpC [Devosia rhizoryzae]|uniref:Potassium-transporting ATPase KdpC subunit n=1 Tax=Devosia rhizoryzae TaxID=2774137 RepID=A0ABX7C5F9_9HYPH|nr:potassium-transporting ATPase subunit KdpC [Devosia rhizoryzae]QQR39484.1 potassium-transporting ATPase subunit KdpC [Devosia rhizoryzae]
MLTQIPPAIVIFGLLSAVTGLLYPLAITGVAQAAFPTQANGSRVIDEGTIIGSDLIGQSFSQPQYFWPRPSATGPEAYNAAASSGSNVGPTGAALIERVGEAVTATGKPTASADAVTTSGSGLDPHITPQNAAAQVERVATARGVDASVILSVLADVTEAPTFAIFGEPRVNVLRLNLALDEAAPLGN